MSEADLIFIPIIAIIASALVFALLAVMVGLPRRRR